MGSPSPSMSTATCTDRWVAAEEKEGQEIGGEKRVQGARPIRGKQHREPILRELEQEEKRIPDAPSPTPIPSAQVTSVGQEPVLFSGSVRDNIAYGLKSCSDEQVMAAAQAANADGFIQDLEHGLYTGTFGQKRN